MKNFKWTAFTKKIAVQASLTTIYQAWAKASEIEKWFLKNADYITSNNQVIDKSANIEKGFTYKWSWFLYEHIESGTILEANGKDHIQFSFAGDCLVDIKLVLQGNYTIVELTQSNIPADDESKQNIRLGCASGWAFYLVNLKSFYENNYDLRNKNADLTGMVNS